MCAAMKNLRALAATLTLLFCSSAILTACGSGADESVSSDDSLQTDRRRKNICKTDKDCHNGQTCQNRVCRNVPPPPPGNGCNTNEDCANGGLCNSSACTANACNQRQAGRTAIRATVKISSYGGVIAGTANGSHEMADGVLSNVLWIFDAKARDTDNVHLAMNVKSSKDPSGLPGEIPLTPGEVIEVEGEYIPASQATGSSGRAVIHFTHSQCGFVDINGTQYR